jgi:hypothetical protein
MLVTLGVILVVVCFPPFVRVTQKDEPVEPEWKWNEKPDEHGDMQHAWYLMQSVVDSFFPKCCRTGYSCQREQ